MAHCDTLAKLLIRGECNPYKQEVAGSSPALPTSPSRHELSPDALRYISGLWGRAFVVCSLESARCHAHRQGRRNHSTDGASTGAAAAGEELDHAGASPHVNGDG